MRISIRAPRENGKGTFRLFLPVPLWIARCGFIWKYLPEEQRYWAGMARELVRALKEYKRQNGSWNLVEVQRAEDNTHVTIRI